MRPHRRKDCPYRARGQACLPAQGMRATAPGCAPTAPEASADTTRPTHRRRRLQPGSSERRIAQGTPPTATRRGGTRPSRSDGRTQTRCGCGHGASGQSSPHRRPTACGDPGVRRTPTPGVVRQAHHALSLPPLGPARGGPEPVEGRRAVSRDHVSRPEHGWAGHRQDPPVGLLMTDDP